MNRKQIISISCVIIFVVSALIVCKEYTTEHKNQEKLEQQQEILSEMKNKDDEKANTTILTTVSQENKILPEYQSIYEENSDFIGWLTIKDTCIDYPVMQTMDDEEYYLKRGFDKQDNENGCLIMDTDSVVGIGTADMQYEDGIRPSTNLIIHGHFMKSGDMFGELDLYEDEDYGKSHSIIQFDSLYEHREYELISVFYSQVYRQSDNVFKYYKFFQADTESEFNDWYRNIKELSLYDTGVEAELGDEFITLSTCSYHVENGRFVVVGRRKQELKKTNNI